MPRYIDADDLKHDIAVLFKNNPPLVDQWLANRVDDVIDEHKARSSVELVRCKDCVYWNRDFVVEDINEEEYCQCNNFDRYLGPNCYCAYGERRTDGQH